MRKTVAAVFMLACIGFVESASAQTPATPPDTATTTAQPVEQPKICVDQDSGGNSRLGTRKVCYTQQEWDALPHRRK